MLLGIRFAYGHPDHHADGRTLEDGLALHRAGPDADRPPALLHEPGCEIWSGTSTGNDPTVLLEVRLCLKDNRVHGQTQWSSTTSGWSLRKLEGERTDDGRYVLKDVEMTEERPEPGWRFCLIEEYELIPEGLDRLTGTYVSEACSDSAVLNLKRVPAPTAGPASTTPSTAGDDTGGDATGGKAPQRRGDPAGTPPDGPRTKDSKAPAAGSSGCACASTSPIDSGRSGRIALLLLAPIFMTTRRQRP